MKTSLGEIIKKCNIDLYGVASGGCLENSREILSHRINNGQITEFESLEIDERINLKNYLDNPKSVIVIGLTYPLLGLEKDNKDKYQGWYTASSMGIDYHILVREKLYLLLEELKKEYDSFSYYLGVDTSPLLDRGFAKESGIGFYGKNSFVINPELGSAFFIGYLITDLDFEITKEKITDNCGVCSKCIDSCPTGAISSNGMDPGKCISYITQKKDLSFEEMDLIGKKLYGCDVCQMVCPYNRENIKNLRYAEKNYIELLELISISNKEYKNLYGNKSFSWRGRKIIKRNAYVALGNYKDEDLYDKLKNFYGKESDYYLIYIARAMYLSDKERFITDVSVEKSIKDKVLDEIEKNVKLIL